MRKSVLFAALTLASVASAQIPIPAFGSTFTSTLTRGYWFTVPVNCIITGIAVPNEASQPFQVVEIIDLNGTPPPAYPGTVVGTQLFYDNTTAGGSIIPTSIVLQPGQVIGVLGACNDTQASATSYNSYGTPAGPFASSILGNPVTLTRFGTQSGIASNGGNQPCWEEPAGACARVELYIQPASGLFANFTSDVTTGATPLTVNFTDNSYSSDPGGVLAWAWDFDGDSVVDSTLQNPTFVYQNCGTYTVSLTVVDATHGTATETKTDYIVTDVISPSFTFALIAPGVVQFTDTSTPTPSSWAWDFDGDNVIDDTTQNPAHFYPAACTAANVSLTVDNSCSGGPWTTSNAIVIAPSTLAAANAGGNGTTGASAGNIFDVQVTNPDGVKICGVTCRPYNYTGAFTMDLYASDGSYLDLVGGVVRHQVPSAWRLIGTGTATSVGGTTTTAQLTFVPLSSPAYLPKGNFSLAVMMTFQTGSAGVCYTTGTAANWGPFADNNMVISPNPTVAGGLGKYNLFGVGANSPRVWNGAFHYSTWSDDGAAGIGFAGTGCANSLGQVPALTPSGNPIVGSALTITVDNCPNNNAIMCTGFVNDTSVFGPLPFDGSPFGAPGCSLRVSTDATLFLIGANNQVNWLFNIPNNPAFSGQQFYNQAIVFDLPANALGAVTSDATGMLIGN